MICNFCKESFNGNEHEPFCTPGGDIAGSKLRKCPDFEFCDCDICNKILENKVAESFSRDQPGY
jgi:hypothetical protein